MLVVHQYNPGMRIDNTVQLTPGTGCRFLEVIRIPGECGFIAKAWRKKLPERMTDSLREFIEFPPRTPDKNRNNIPPRVEILGLCCNKAKILFVSEAYSRCSGITAEAIYKSACDRFFRVTRRGQSMRAVEVEKFRIGHQWGFHEISDSVECKVFSCSS